MPYVPGPEPLNTSSEGLGAYLQEELRKLSVELGSVEAVILPTLHVEPDKPRDGMVVLADGTDFNPGSGAGFYGRSAGAWEFLSLVAGPTPVTSVTGSAPITSSGGTTPDIAITAATPSASGAMSAADKTKLDDAGGILATEQFTVSGTSIDFTSIPSWVKRITIALIQVSTTGTSIPMIQIGDAGGIETSSYIGTATQLAGVLTHTAYSSGFLLSGAHASSVSLTGHLTLTLEDSVNNAWVGSGVIARDEATVISITAGAKQLTATLDRIRLTTVGGSDTFDQGVINIIYE